MLPTFWSYRASRIVLPSERDAPRTGKSKIGDLPVVAMFFICLVEKSKNLILSVGCSARATKKMQPSASARSQTISVGGSEFIVRLPLAAEQSKRILAEPISETDIIQTAQMKMPDDSKKPGFHLEAENFRILVVDDNTDVAEMLEVLLSMQGHIIRVALNAPTALEMAEEFEPKICLSDIGLPGMSGYEPAMYLREMLPQALLISVSGWGQDEDRQKSKEAGFNHHLVKPVQFDDLLKLIQLNMTENK